MKRFKSSIIEKKVEPIDGVDLSSFTIIERNEKVEVEVEKLQLSTLKKAIVPDASYTTIIRPDKNEFLPEELNESFNIIYYRGPQGLHGPQGIRGPQGERGLIGEKGPQGPEGPQGPKGDRGEKGDKGDMGDRGDQGIPGVNGNDGKDGAKGDKGDKGDTGEKGDAGEQGPKGDRGDRGEQGPKGDRGNVGQTGIKGDKGDKGDRGEPGEDGKTGERGEKGDTGDRGERGPEGPAGKDGQNGKDGLPGKQGPKGETGDKGDRGDKGLDGKDGRDGNDGKDGRDGADGAQGETGPEGPVGPKGDKGDMPKHELNKGAIRFENPDGSWGPFINIQKIVDAAVQKVNPNVASNGLGGGGENNPSLLYNGLMMRPDFIEYDKDSFGVQMDGNTMKIVSYGGAAPIVYTDMQDTFKITSLPASAFTLSFTPLADSDYVYLNGLFLTAEIDYTIRGTSLIMLPGQARLMKVGHRLTVKYKIQE